MSTTTCPVCNQTTVVPFCQHCGFEIHFLPTTISAEVRAYEEKRIKKYKEMLAKKDTEPKEDANPSVPFPSELTQADKCPVCEAEMIPEQTFCEHCGWVRTLYPKVAPPAIVEMEKQRVEMMRKAYQQRQNDRQQHSDDIKKLNEEIERQKQLVEAEQKKNKQLVEDNEKKEKQLKDDNDKLFDDLYTTKGQLDEAQKALSAAQSDRDAAIKDRDQAQQKLQTEKTEHDKTKQVVQDEKRQLDEARRQLREEENAHAKTKRELEALRKTAPTHTPSPTQTTPVNRGEKKGDVVFSANGNTVKLPLYEGTNVFTAPEGIDCGVGGVLFSVEINGVEVRIFDACGQTRRANGHEIGPKGKSVYPADVFAVGKVKITFELRDVDLDTILGNI